MLESAPGCAARTSLRGDRECARVASSLETKSVTRRLRRGTDLEGGWMGKGGPRSSHRSHGRQPGSSRLRFAGRVRADRVEADRGGSTTSSLSRAGIDLRGNPAIASMLELPGLERLRLGPPSNLSHARGASIVPLETAVRGARDLGAWRALPGRRERARTSRCHAGSTQGGSSMKASSAWPNAHAGLSRPTSSGYRVAPHPPS